MFTLFWFLRKVRLFFDLHCDCVQEGRPGRAPTNRVLLKIANVSQTRWKRMSDAQPMDLNFAAEFEESRSAKRESPLPARKARTRGTSSSLRQWLVSFCQAAIAIPRAGLHDSTSYALARSAVADMCSFVTRPNRQMSRCFIVCSPHSKK